MRTLEVTDAQVHVIQAALDMYSRIGIGQFQEIKDHPTFQEHLYKACTPKKAPEVGDRTPQGEILEIKGKKALISGSVKDNKWCADHEWKNIKDVKLSTDYSKYHDIRDMVDQMFVHPRNMLMQDMTLGGNASWGIHSPNVDESCRVAYDLTQVIRHQYWKENEKRSNMTVDSSIHTSTKDSDKIKFK
jgi:hypothetical protein